MPEGDDKWVKVFFELFVVLSYLQVNGHLADIIFLQVFPPLQKSTKMDAYEDLRRHQWLFVCDADGKMKVYVTAGMLSMPSIAMPVESRVCQC